MTKSALRAWLVARVAEMCARDPREIDTGERFVRHGLDSVRATELVIALSAHLVLEGGAALSPTLVWEHPTIDALAAHLTGGASSTSREPGRGQLDAEPVAIVGMACRFPRAPDDASFWRLLESGTDAVSWVPADRGWEAALAAAGIAPAERDEVRRGAFLDRIDGFDPLFFKISPREATSMDPQQRLMLELCWEALENAGIPPGSLLGSRTGVFSGAIWSDYEALLYRGAANDFDRYAVTGAHRSIIANRVSYALGLMGPSLAVDTACSSGLVVVHLACESLRRGESTLALAGAVNLDVLPESALAMARLGALSPDGRCYAFDARANGYVRGEGGGVVALKLLSRALADGDPIRALLRGSVVNNDGASNGLTAPHPAAQKAMLREAHASSSSRVCPVQYIEAHGTGTPLGDPIEARAIGEVLAAGRRPAHRLLLGSVKTNIGHLEAAAGIAGLAKVVLAIEHRRVPPSLHFESPNPNVPLRELGLEVPTTACSWPAPDEALVAGVSSFGMGGTNSHVVVEEWAGPPAEILPLVAASHEALRAEATALRERLSGDAGRDSLRALCTEAASRSRSADGARAAFVAGSHGELDRALATFASARAPCERGLASGGVVFSFPGQGSQWHGMGKTLLSTEPVFRAALEACDAHIREHLGWSLIEVLTAPHDDGRLDDVEVSFPAVVAVDIAIAAWWRSLGIEPAAVVGNSVGEIAAAHVAGILDLADAMRIVCVQGRLLARLGEDGRMALVDLGWEATGEALTSIEGRFEGRVFRAIQDSAEATVVAGKLSDVGEFLSALMARGIRSWPVRTNRAPHSRLADALREELARELQGIRPRPGRARFVSEVTGAVVDGRRLDGSHWVRNLCEPALFGGAVDALIREGHRIFLDVGAHPTTRRSIEANLRRASVDGVALGSLRRDERERRALFASLAVLHDLGVPVRWGALYPTAQDAEALGESCLLPLSARDPRALVAEAAALAERFKGEGHEPLADIAYTASVRRDHHEHRLAIVGRSRAEMRAELASFARGEGIAARGRLSASGAPKVVFVFPGQGSQWVGMGRGLLVSENAFRTTLEACDDVMAREAGFSILDELTRDEARSRLSDIGIVQPVLFAVEVALAALWRSWGVEPHAVVGHSMGEVAAAHVAGILSLQNAVRVIARRSRLLRGVSGRGAMAVVELGAVEAGAVLAGYEDRLSVAVSNGPRSTVLSGDPLALEEVLGTLTRRGVFCRRVQVDVASHSPQMEPLLGDLEVLLWDVRSEVGTIAMRSTVTGAPIEGPELDAGYWVKNLRKPVLFARTIQDLAAEGHSLFVEMSPHPILLPALEENLRAAAPPSSANSANSTSASSPPGVALGSLRRNADERSALLASLGEAWVRGVPVQFRALYPELGRVVRLPPYPWQRERFWLETKAPSAGDAIAWQPPAFANEAPWLGDHRLAGAAVVAGGAFVEMALAAGRATYGQAAFEVVELRMERMLSLPCEGVEIAVQRATGHATLRITSRAEGASPGECHVTADLRAVPAEAPAVGETPSAIVRRCAEVLLPAEHHARLERAGVTYGPHLRTVERLRIGQGEAMGDVRLPRELRGEAAAYEAHPALVDGAFQVLEALVLSRPNARLLVPASLARIRLHARLPERIFVHARWGGDDAALTVLADDGRVLLEMRGLRLVPLAHAPSDEGRYHVAFRRHDLAPPSSAPPASKRRPEPAPWLVFRDAQGTGSSLATALRAIGETCIELDAADANPAEKLPPTCRGVVHCGSLDAATWEWTCPVTLEADLRRSVHAAVSLVQAVLHRAYRTPPRVFFLTRAARAVGVGPVSAVQAPLWGMGRVLALEHPELQCVRIDLPATAMPEEAELLARELSAGDGETEIALRPEGRFVARLVRGNPETPPIAPPSTLVAEGTYLITGGLGGLGLALARSMVERGARSVVLMGRSEPRAESRAALRAMESLGARVHVARGDVAHLPDVERIVGEIQARFPPLRGVVHAAAVVADRTLLELGKAQLSATFRPKIVGTWNLHTATRALPLDFFVLYSSASSVLGVPGQAAYASANAFLDAFAHARVASGLPTTSIQWGLFAGVGVAAPDLRSVRLASQGIESFTVEEGVDLFHRAIAQPHAEIGMFRFSLPKWLDALPQAAGLAYFSELPGETAPASQAPPASMRDGLARAPVSERAAQIEAHVIAELGHVLRIAPSRIDPDAPFKSLGLDSLSSLEVRNRLERSLGIKLSAALLFTYSQASTLAQHLLQHLSLGPTDEEVAKSVRYASEEPLAIVGLACRFPGGSNTPQAYWDMLERGGDGVVEIPSQRWPRSAIPGDRPETRRAALLDEIEGFDAAFFGISPREASSLDPQQRLLLEVALEALEDAGIAPSALSDSPTGVFVGLNALDYQHRLIERGLEHVDAYSTTGNLLSTAAGRISYTFHFRGPCVTVDTACSSSLVSIALACQALRSGDCDVVLAGGANVILSPYAMAALAGTQALAPDGRCRTLDARANGFVRGEGAGLVVLKRLSDAHRDGDRIQALVRGWAINQDGRSSGLTAPNVLAQQEMLRKALAHARVSPDDIGYVELHGTGTPLGDPIEFEALREVVGKSRADGTRCVLGAVKTNIGHLESAAGIAGLMKAVLALEHESIPGNLHFQTLNPRISLLGTAFEIPRGNVAWKRGDKGRYAGVSSFGISGTNAHVIVEESPEREEREGTSRSAELLVVSAKSEGALRAAAKRLHGHLEGHPELELGDVAWSLATTRDAWPHRLALSVSSREEALEALRLAGQGETAAGMHRHHVEPSARGKVVFVFPGQGSQWLGMGRELLAEEPVFRKALEACDEAIRLEAGFSVLEELRAEEGSSRLGDIAVVQPVLFAMEVALTAMWRSWGVEPDCVVGHSLGETAAAYVCGALGLEDAVAVICRRSRLLKRLSGQGEMAVVELSLEEAEWSLAGYEDRLGVAVSNSPRTTVLSGESRALGELLATLEARDVFCRRVKVDVASHSPHVEVLRDDLMKALSHVQGKRARIAMRSTVTCADVEGPELVAGYWMENLRKPVRFAPVIESLLAEGYGVFIEMSPHPLLVTAIEEMHAGSGVAVGSLRRERPERQSLLDALGALWAHGKAIAWNEVRPGARRVALPTYPWERERHWIEATPGRRTLRAGHPLLGEGLSVSSQDGMRIWETTLDRSRLPWLSDHRVRGMVVFPGAGYLEMALAAGREIFGDAPFEVRDVALVEALSLSPEQTPVVQVVATADGASDRRFQIASRRVGQENDTWTVHAHGTLGRLGVESPLPQAVSLSSLRARMGKSSTATSVYAALGKREMDYGPAFRGVLELLHGAGEALGRVKWPEALGEGAEYTVHPALLDACFQVMAVALEDGRDRAWVGVEVAKLRVHGKPSGELFCHVRFGAESRTEQGARQRSADLQVYDETGQRLIDVEGLRVQELAAAARPHDDDILELRWEPSAISAPKIARGHYLLLGDGQGTGEALRAALEAAGHAVVHAASFAAAGESAPTAVVHLASLAPVDPLDAESLEAAFESGYDCVLSTVQAIAAKGYRSAPRLWLATRGAQATGACEVAPLQAPRLGLGRVIAMEHPELRCTRLDLDPSPDANEIDRIVAELLADGDEQEIALRGDQRLVARLVRTTRDPSHPATGAASPSSRPWGRRDGSYLLTGGLGGLGLRLAAWLAERGAGHLWLVGRSGAATVAQQAAVAALKAQGARVTVVQSDVAERARLEAVLATIAASGPPLRGIVHAAGILEDGLLLRQTPAQFRRVMAPKILGALHLDALTKEVPLDFFVLYGSAAGLLGTPGQGNYAAANAFLDALAHRRRAEGRPALCVDWGAFSEVGLAAAEEKRGLRLASRGIGSMRPDEGLDALARLLETGRTQAAVVRLEVRQWVEFYPSAAASSMLAHLLAERSPVASSARAEGLFDRLTSAGPVERKSLLLDFVRKEAARVLRIPDGKLDTRAPLTSLGLDSLMGLELRNGLEAGLGTRMRATLLWAYPTVAALAEHLSERLAPAAAPLLPAPALETPPPPLQSDIDEGALLALLDESLARTNAGRV